MRVVPPMTAPICPCGTTASLTTGKEIYPGRLDLEDKPIWLCRICGNYVGCHPGTFRSLGVPADAKTRKARMLLHHRMIDPVWTTATRYYQPENEAAANKIRKIARHRVYAYIGEKLGLPRGDVHTGMFTIEQCREAWTIMRGVTYRDIRAWAKARPPKEITKKPRKKKALTAKSAAEEITP